MKQAQGRVRWLVLGGQRPLPPSCGTPEPRGSLPGPADVWLRVFPAGWWGLENRVWAFPLVLSARRRSWHLVKVWWVALPF